MPELPEVETVKESLKKLVLNKKIVDVVVRYPNIVSESTVEDFINNAKRDPYLKDQGASDELIQAIGRKRYCMETTANLRFYAVPVEDDKIIGHAFKEGILK